ncbi:hypothetical protein ACFL52_02685 [Candidatus Margulisiibacteriota bacterium]
MTFVIGIQSDFYNIVAADTRVTNLFGTCYQDGEHKIINCNLGLVSGSGWVAILNGVKEKLLSAVITNTDQVTNIIRGEFRRIGKLPYPTNFIASDLPPKNWTSTG